MENPYSVIVDLKIELAKINQEYNTLNKMWIFLMNSRDENSEYKKKFIELEKKNIELMNIIQFYEAKNKGINGKIHTYFIKPEFAEYEEGLYNEENEDSPYGMI